MDFSKNELKAVWARTDEYYRFRYEEYSSFAARLRKWRELNDISQMEMATALFDYRAAMGLEDEEIQGILRFSFAESNTLEEVKIAADAIREEVAILREFRQR